MIKNNKKGFTLIELLVVIAIIGLLSTLAVVALNSARAKSRDAKRVADVKQMQTALELYFNECNGYPTLQVTTGSIFENDANFSTLKSTAVYNDGPKGTGGIDCGTEFKTFMANIPEPPTPTDNNTLCGGIGGVVGWEGANEVINTYYYAACNADGTKCDGEANNNGASYALEYCLGGQTGGIDAGKHYANPGGMK